MKPEMKEVHATSTMPLMPKPDSTPLAWLGSGLGLGLRLGLGLDGTSLAWLGLGLGLGLGSGLASTPSASLGTLVLSLCLSLCLALCPKANLVVRR